MKKIHLDLDTLAVETFATTPDDARAADGTVLAHGRTNNRGHTCELVATCFTCNYLDSCYGALSACGRTCTEPTCEQTCLETCAA